jgi:hypothetical protein
LTQYGGCENSLLMKKILKWSMIAALLFSLNSCGLPAALGRTAGSLVNSASGLVGPAMALGAL